MDPVQEQQLNQAAFRRLSAVIRTNYPPGRFVAIAGGNIVADAAGFNELDTLLHRLGHHSGAVLVVQAGVDYPESVAIFCQDTRR